MKYSKHCYGITGLSAETPWQVNSGFVVGNKATLIIDTGSNYLAAKTIYGYCRSVNVKNTLIGVNTEPHFDHIGGNSFFQEKGVDIYAHPAIRRKPEDFLQNKRDFNSTIVNKVRRSRNESDAFFYMTTLANPNKPLAQGDSLDLGGIMASAHETPGHTPYNISLFIDTDGVLFTGDTVVSGYLPNLEGGRTKDWENWLTSIECIERLHPEILIPGHGDVIEGPREIRMALENLRSILVTAIKKKKPPTSV